MDKFKGIKHLLAICMMALMIPMIYAQAEDEETASSIYERQLLSGDQLPSQLLESGVVVIQKGNANTSAVDIHNYGEPSGVIVTQLGNQNSSAVIGETSSSRIGILQNGDLNDLSLDLRDDYNCNLEFYQYGNGNTILQKLNSSLNANMIITQSGDDHLIDFETDLIEIPGLRITQMGQGAELIIVQ